MSPGPLILSRAKWYMKKVVAEGKVSKEVRTLRSRTGGNLECETSEKIRRYKSRFPNKGVIMGPAKERIKLPGDDCKQL